MTAIRTPKNAIEYTSSVAVDEVIQGEHPMALSALKLDAKDGIALITFDQPGSRANTLGQAVLAEFEEVLGKVEKHSDLRGLILASGKPGMFIAGADLKEMGSAESNPE